MKQKTIQYITKQWKAFCRNQILALINLLAIVLALVVITMASSFLYLKYQPSSPASNANNFFRLRAEDKSGEWLSITTKDCEQINEAE